MGYESFTPRESILLTDDSTFLFKLRYPFIHENWNFILKGIEIPVDYCDNSYNFSVGMCIRTVGRFYVMNTLRRERGKL